MSRLGALLRRIIRRYRNDRPHDRHKLFGCPAKPKRGFQFDFLKGQGLVPSDYLIDIGCATLRGGIPLIRYLEMGQCYGVESCGYVLDEGRIELREAKFERIPESVQRC